MLGLGPSSSTISSSQETHKQQGAAWPKAAIAQRLHAASLLLVCLSDMAAGYACHMGAYRLLRGSLHVWLLRIVARLAVLPGIRILVWLGVCSRHHGRHISRCWRICLLLGLILLLLLLLLLWRIGLPWADAVLGRVALLLTVWRHLLLAGIICCWRGLLARVIAMMWLLLLRGSLHARCCQCKPSGFLTWMVA